MVSDRHQLQTALRHWRETIPDDRLAHLVKDAARCFTRALQIRLGAYGVSFGHWVFLRILWEENGLTQRELSERAGLTEPTTFSALKAMEKLGYICRAEIPGNRKSVRIELTEAGMSLKGKLVPLAEEVNRVATAGIADADIAAVRRTLLAMVANLAADEAEGNSGVPPTRLISLP